MKRFAAVLVAVAMTLSAGVMKAQAASDSVLTTDEVKKLLPERVYYKGQSATTQLRNSGGVKFADGLYVLATLVDTSGYSTDVASKYQAYFVAETALKIGGQDLPAGVYGLGFVGDKLIVTDIGGHDLLSVAVGTDEGLKRPMPLQIVADKAGGFRLYKGRAFVHFSR
jgi:hypothetical protein